MCGHPLQGTDRNKGRKTEQQLSIFFCARKENASLKATHSSFYFISTSTRCLKECGEMGCNGWKAKEKKAGKDHFYHAI